MLGENTLPAGKRKVLEGELTTIGDNMAEGCYSGDPDDGIDWSSCPGISNGRPYEPEPEYLTFICPEMRYKLWYRNDEGSMTYDDTIPADIIPMYRDRIDDALEQAYFIQVKHPDVIGVTPGVVVIDGKLHGTLTVSSSHELSPETAEELRNTLTGLVAQWSIHFEGQQIQTDGGNLYVRFYDSNDPRSKNMINISISRSPDYAQSHKLKLPASRYDILDSCSRVGVNNLDEAHYMINAAGLTHNVLSLLRAESKDNMTFNELNFTAERLEALSPDDLQRLNGLAYMRPPDTMKGFINMTYNLDNVMIAGGIETPRQLGAFLVENGFVEFPEDVIPYLDFAKIGEQHLAENTCAIVDGVYFEDTRSPDEIKEVYNGITLPEQSSDDYVFFVRIGNPEHDPNDSLFAELHLPASEDEMTDALEFIGVSFPFNVVITNFESRIAAFAGIADEHTDLSTLNDLADQIERMTDEDYVKYNAPTPPYAARTNGSARS